MLNRFLSNNLHISCFTVICLLLICGISPTYACLWDRNTIEREAKEKPDVLKVITGRFPRNPTLFYEMRIEREESELKTNPNRYENYDDIAVAYDRLGDDDKAIQWIQQKRLHLPTYNPENASIKDQWYRYWANLGTFQVHRWLRHGANQTRINEVKQSQKSI